MVRGLKSNWKCWTFQTRFQYLINSEKQKTDIEEHRLKASENLLLWWLRVVNIVYYLCALQAILLSITYAIAKTTQLKSI